MPVCCRILSFDSLAVSVPMSAAMMLFSALVRLVIWLFMTLVAAVNWFEPAPRLPRSGAIPAMAELMLVSAAWAFEAEDRVLLAMLIGVVDPLATPRFESLTTPRFTVTVVVPLPEESL